MRNFRELEIWKRSFDLVIRIYKITRLLPSDEKFCLVSQINRSAISIPSNIAEGCGRNTNSDLCRFVDIALGSSFELETQLLLTKELYAIEEISGVVSELHEIQKMMNSFKKYLKPKA
ncbi:MAG: four helix bundle protein [Bacteroidia bacterium]|nr:four helix bundle protein [Bacteroidia bacterium]